MATPRLLSVAGPPERMLMWLDCEFNGYLGELLSIALVADDNTVFYEALIPSERMDPWVREHVMPQLKTEPRAIGEVQTLLQLFLAKYHGGGVHIIADWPDDIVYFCRLLLTGPGTRLKPLPAMTFELRLDLSSEAALHPHNALSDAFAIRHDWQKKEAPGTAIE